MAKVSTIQTNFTAGEITPRMKGRVDVARYANGAEIIENGVPVVHGGVDRRDGMRYLATQKYSATRKVRLIRYVFNATQAYMLEFGHLHVRVYTSTGALVLNSGLTPLEIPSPYTEDQLFAVTTKQGADTMFLYHPDVPTQRLRRITADIWVLHPVPWVTEPFDELGHAPNAVLSLSAASIGTGRTFTTADTTAPGAPVIGTAFPLKASASVNFTAPASDGGLPVTQYTATSSPGGITGTGASSPIRVNGLTNGVAYTFTVTATNAQGTSAASAASNSITPLSSLPDGSLTVTASPADFSTGVAAGLSSHIAGPTASADGTGPYIYAWTKLSGSPAVGITRGNTAQVELYSDGEATTNYAAFRCTVQDSLGSVGIVDVNISVRHRTQVTPKPTP